MDRIDECLKQIGELREVAAGLEVPYVARSRIGRLTLSAIGIVAERAGLPAPTLPSPIRLPDDVPGQLHELAKRCNRILEVSRDITQPSEPLADRWTHGWDSLLEELELLETHLRLVHQDA